MKKAFSFILSALLIVAFPLSACAEEFNGGDLFLIELPDGFEQQGAPSSDYYFVGEDGSSLSISCNDNELREEAFCPKNFSRKDVEAYCQAICTDTAVAVAELTEGFEMKVVSCEKVKHPDGSEALSAVFETRVKSGKKTNVYYQKLYELGGINNKYSFSYTTTEKDDIGRMDSAFESIDVFEAYARSRGENAAVYAAAAIVAFLIVGGIIRFIRTPEKKQREKKR